MGLHLQIFAPSYSWVINVQIQWNRSEIKVLVSAKKMVKVPYQRIVSGADT